MAIEHQPVTTTARSPRRKWSIWRWLMLGCLALVVVHAIWGWVAGQRLRSVVAGLRAKGEMTVAADLNGAAVPDADNAALDYWPAGRSIKWDSPAHAAFNKLEDYRWPLSDQDLATFHAFVMEYAPALALADTGSKKSRADWGIKSTTPMHAVLLRHLSDARQLAVLLQAAAYDAHGRGDDAQAVHRLLQILALARAIDAPPSFNITHMVRMGCDNLATTALQEMAASLVIEPASPKTPNVKPAQRQQVDALLAELTADGVYLADWHRAMAGERVEALDSADTFISGKMGAWGTPLTGFAATGWQAAVKGYVLQPLIFQDARVMTDALTKVIAAGQSPDWPTATTLAGNPNFYRANGYLHPWAAEMMGSYDRILLNHFRSWTNRRLAATALALRASAADHAGQLPARLDDLVPGYLPRLPIDPMARGGTTPLRYRATGDDPLIYSVGENGLDDGGSDVTLPKTNYYSIWNHQDAVVHLTPQPTE